MARRKINIQRSLGAKGINPKQFESTSPIEQLAESMSTTNMGFRPTDQRVYEIDLERISPDPEQPRHLLPNDLRVAIFSGEFSPSEAMKELLSRAEQDDTVALLILGRKEKEPANEEDDTVEDTGLFALAQSIREVGLRHPLNVYRIDDPDSSGQINYRVGEGERRFWAHHLLVSQGYDEFRRVKCIVETLPEDEEVIHQRQEAENAARVDLPAIARARSMARIKERLNIELGTRVPGENTIKLPSQRELQTAVGQQVKVFTGRAIGDRMVRNYLALLNLSPQAQDLAEAAQLSEKQLRPVMRLKTDAEQLTMIQKIIDEDWSGRQVQREVAGPPKAKSTLREVKQTSVEQRFEKRVMDAVKTMHSLLTLPQENYNEAITTLAARAKDSRMRQAMQSLRQAIEEVLLRAEDFPVTTTKLVSLISVIPPLEGLRQHLPAEKIQLIQNKALTGHQILDQLLQWQAEDAIIASRLESFLRRIEADAEALRAGEVVRVPELEAEKSTAYPDAILYRVISGASVYWAHELLVRKGEAQFKEMKAQIVNVTYSEDD